MQYATVPKNEVLKISRLDIETALHRAMRLGSGEPWPTHRRVRAAAHEALVILQSYRDDLEYDYPPLIEAVRPLQREVLGVLCGCQRCGGHGRIGYAALTGPLVRIEERLIPADRRLGGVYNLAQKAPSRPGPGYNPLRLSIPLPGSTDYNADGVQNYPDMFTASQAFAITLKSGRYPMINNLTQASDSTTDELIDAMERSPWGRGGLGAIHAMHQRDPAAHERAMNDTVKVVARQIDEIGTPRNIRPIPNRFNTHAPHLRRELRCPKGGARHQVTNRRLLQQFLLAVDKHQQAVTIGAKTANEPER